MYICFGLICVARCKYQQIFVGCLTAFLLLYMWCVCVRAGVTWCVCVCVCDKYGWVMSQCDSYVCLSVWVCVCVSVWHKWISRVIVRVCLARVWVLSLYEGVTPIYTHASMFVSVCVLHISKHDWCFCLCFSVYKCVRVCVCACTYNTHVHVCPDTLVWRVCACACVHVHACACVCMCVCVCVCVQQRYGEREPPSLDWVAVGVGIVANSPKSVCSVVCIAVCVAVGQLRHRNS